MFGLFTIYGVNNWLKPFISWYVETAHCHQPFGIDGLVFLWYCLFVGLPLHIVPIIALVTWPTAYRSLRQNQYPPVGQKVYRKTEIIFGTKAKLKAILMFIPALLFLAIATWGYFQVDNMPVAKDNVDYSVCEN